LAIPRVNIIVGNINEDNIERLNILIEFFHKKGKIFLYTLYNNCDKIQDLTLNDSIVYLWILPNDIESDNIINGYNLLGVATNQSDFDKYTQKSDLLLECYPLHTGNNNQFCKELMSFDKKDILSLHLSEKEIFANQNINSNLFGEITIVPNGSIYSCINKDPIGSFYSDELKDILFNEFLKFKNWFFTRNKINKCNKCIFNFLCPPVTNFEMCLNDMSFCD
jgi:pseudo-rSAM protein